MFCAFCASLWLTLFMLFVAPFEIPLPFDKVRRYSQYNIVRKVSGQSSAPTGLTCGDATDLPSQH
jgi:hypothetical protein